SSRPATSTHHIGAQNNQFTAPYSIPQTLTVSQSLGGQPLSPELAVEEDERPLVTTESELLPSNTSNSNSTNLSETV
ncbi:hypothetical protein QQF64_034316, partial [Cirrhinus molitorella]